MLPNIDEKTSKDSLERSMETLNELLDKKFPGKKLPSAKEQLRGLVKSVKKAEKEIKKGEVFSFDEVFK